MIMNKEFLN